jgi:CRISPR/Cas system-associated endoribonuclease Cas2
VVRGQELLTFVIYDIADDLVRSRVANACKDYGLERIQYSAFSGSLDASRRVALATRLADTLGLVRIKLCLAAPRSVFLRLFLNFFLRYRNQSVEQDP